MNISGTGCNSFIGLFNNIMLDFLITHSYNNPIYRDTAAFTKRIFNRTSPDRFNAACQKFKKPIEADQCFKKLRTQDDKTVLRFCQNCMGKEIYRSIYEHYNS